MSDEPKYKRLTSQCHQEPIFKKRTGFDMNKFTREHFNSALLNFCFSVLKLLCVISAKNPLSVFGKRNRVYTSSAILGHTYTWFCTLKCRKSFNVGIITRHSLKIPKHSRSLYVSCGRCLWIGFPIQKICTRVVIIAPNRQALHLYTTFWSVACSFINSWRFGSYRQQPF